MQQTVKNKSKLFES